MIIFCWIDYILEKKEQVSLKKLSTILIPPAAWYCSFREKLRLAFHSID